MLDVALLSVLLVAIAIGYGLFDDDTLAAPDRSVWEMNRHDWVAFAPDDRWIMGRAGPKVAT